MATVESGDSSSGDAFVSIGSGAMQVYDANAAGALSGIISAILGKQARVIAGDWRGVQYWVDAAEGGAGSSPVWIFDPSTMGNDKTVDLASFVRLLPSEAMLDAVDTSSFNAWLSSNGRASIGESECVPVNPPQLVSGLENPIDRANYTVSTAEYLIYCAKALRVMKDLGLRSGDPIPDNFGELVSAV
ncbi:hypothetical protein FK268_10770 [Tsukamurella sputi]|uniref:Uncharacterized protein n=1 Tax=Tsukamurella sputi TaxID=2591848 RepID=A0A5C5RNE5_9ACTN|nr:hypothetical protein [Tsukamurella sputi]TWS24104.1 hypothetical protein FK268_10770 [Tsukamurella sputi]